MTNASFELVISNFVGLISIDTKPHQETVETTINRNKTDKHTQKQKTQENPLPQFNLEREDSLCLPP